MAIATKTVYSEVIPILKSLSEKQRTRYMVSAPDGNDSNNENEVTVINTPVINPDIQVKEPSVIEKNIAKKINSVSLEEKIQLQIVQDTLEQFGYSLFSDSTPIETPQTNTPIPSNYILGPGDTLIIQLYGKLNVEYKLVIRRDGRILVPEIGPIQVSGLTFTEVKELINELFNNQFVGANAITTMGNIRTIQVMVIGDVVRPGTYTISSLATLTQSLFISGGIKRSGSLRNIQVTRNNKTHQKFDLYDLLINGSTQGNVNLMHGDVIFIPPIGPTIGIGGEINRPGIYEINTENSVLDIINLAGGLLPSSDLNQSHIERIHNNNYRTLVDINPNITNGLSTNIQAGDLIRIFPVIEQMDEVVLLSGHVRHPGGYQRKPEMRITDLISSPNVLRQNADLRFSILKRELRNQKRITTHYLNLEKLFSNPASKMNLLLNPRDEIIVFDREKKRSDSLESILHLLNTQTSPSFPTMVINIMGHLTYPGKYPLPEKTRLLDVLNAAGGILAETDLHYLLIFRKSPDRKKRIVTHTYDIQAALDAPESENNPYIYPEDRIFVFNQKNDRASMIKADINQFKKQTKYGELTHTVFVNGTISHPGEYPLSPGMRITDLIKASGGLNENTYSLSAELTRYVLVNGEYRITNHSFINMDKVLQGHITNNSILKPYDHLVFHTKPEWRDKMSIQIAGEIVFPGTYPVSRTETLCQVLQRAGNFTDGAYPFGAIFIRESVRIKQQKALDRIHDDLDDLLVQIHLSPSVNNDEKMPAGEGKHQILKAIKQLQRAKALGRMVIDLEEARHCGTESDLVLENGDKLFIPKYSNEVTVMGEVYFSTSHLYRKNRGARDYITLSGGSTVLAKTNHAYIVQANGEINTIRSNWFSFKKNYTVTPGATIYVPINVDRVNNRESAQAWTQVLFHLATSAAGLSVVGIF